MFDSAGAVYVQCLLRRKINLMRSKSQATAQKKYFPAQKNFDGCAKKY